MWAAIFPGQGSQHPGMGKDLYAQFKIAKETYEEGSDALRLDLKKLCFEGPDTELKLTANTQPALLVTSIAAWRVFTSESPARPIVALGHSLGEYSALVAAEALSLAEALVTVRVRGQAMQDAVPVGTGGMTAVLGLEDEKVVQACKDIIANAPEEAGIRNCVLEVANFNSPGQVVISGHQKALDYMKANFKGGKLIPLAVSAPFHSSLMKPAAEKLKGQLEKVHWAQKLKFEVIHNLTAANNNLGSKLTGMLYEQMTKPVLWTASVKNSGVTQFAEFGAGRVLAGLNKKILSDSKTSNIDTTDNLKLALEALT